MKSAFNYLYHPSCRMFIGASSSTFAETWALSRYQSRDLNTCLGFDYLLSHLFFVSVARRRKGIYIERNDHGRTQKCDFSVLNWKYPFWASLVETIKIVSFSWNVICWLIRICRIQWWCSPFPSSTENTLFEQICSQIQNSLFKMKFGT